MSGRFLTMCRFDWINMRDKMTEKITDWIVTNIDLGNEIFIAKNFSEMKSISLTYFIAIAGSLDKEICFISNLSSGCFLYKHLNSNERFSP